MSEFVLTVDCPSTRGIVAAISSYLAARGCNIIDSAQFVDVDTNRFFMRVGVQLRRRRYHSSTIVKGFAPVAEPFAMNYRFPDPSTSDEGRPHGVALRPLPQRHPLSLEDRSAADRYRRRGVEPSRLPAGRGEPRHPFLPRPGHKGEQGRRPKPGSWSSSNNPAQSSSFLPATCRFCRMRCAGHAGPHHQYSSFLPAELQRRQPLQASL